MNQYFLFLYEAPTAVAGISPEEMQKIVARYIAWRNDVAAKGHMLGGNKLRDGEGRVMRPAACSAFQGFIQAARRFRVRR